MKSLLLKSLKYFLISLAILSTARSQTYEVGDIVENFSAPICQNGDGYWEYNTNGRNKVVWLNLFTSWWPSCSAEAPQTEYIYQNFINEEVVVIAAGQDWNQPYSCLQWGTEFGLTYPILDDITNIYGLFGVGYIPHHIVIGGDGEVIYSASGFNQTAIINYINQGLENLDQDIDSDGINDNFDNCMYDYNPAQLDVDSDGMGNVCDQCDNNVFVRADLNADGTQNLIDALILLDVILGYNLDPCPAEVGDINDDGIVNVLDVIVFLQDMLNGSTSQAMAYIQSILTTDEFNRLTEEFHYVGTKFLYAWPNPSNQYMNIAGNGLVTIYDMMGRVVHELNIDGTYRWNTSNLPTGIYHMSNGYDRIQVTLVK